MLPYHSTSTFVLSPCKPETAIARSADCQAFPSMSYELGSYELGSYELGSYELGSYELGLDTDAFQTNL